VTLGLPVEGTVEPRNPDVRADAIRVDAENAPEREQQCRGCAMQGVVAFGGAYGSLPAER
jgi:hypothetical protein